MLANWEDEGVARTDNDTWEITESVGATALGVAAARAAETESENPLISDPFARVFLNAAGDGMWNWFAAPDLPAEIAEAEPDLKPRMQGMVDYMAARTSFFDQFFLDATRAGVREVVILAAGLDSRAWRRAKTAIAPRPTRRCAPSCQNRPAATRPASRGAGRPGHAPGCTSAAHRRPATSKT